MSGLHTPGRLFVAEDIEDDTPHPETVIRGMGGHACVAVVLDFGANNPDWREANAKRMVACWNALDGLHDDALGGGWTAAGMNSYAKGLERKLTTALALLAEAVRPHNEHVTAVRAAGEQPVINPLAAHINNFLKGDAT